MARKIFDFRPNKRAQRLQIREAKRVGKNRLALQNATDAMYGVFPPCARFGTYAEVVVTPLERGFFIAWTLKTVLSSGYYFQVERVRKPRVAQVVQYELVR